MSDDRPLELGDAEAPLCISRLDDELEIMPDPILLGPIPIPSGKKRIRDRRRRSTQSGDNKSPLSIARAQRRDSRRLYQAESG